MTLLYFSMFQHGTRKRMKIKVWPLQCLKPAIVVRLLNDVLISSDQPKGAFVHSLEAVLLQQQQYTEQIIPSCHNYEMPLHHGTPSTSEGGCQRRYLIFYSEAVSRLTVDNFQIAYILRDYLLLPTDCYRVVACAIQRTNV